MTRVERAEAVLALAVCEATKGCSAAAGFLIRQRVKSCLSTALAICKEDPRKIYDLIDDERNTVQTRR